MRKQMSQGEYRKEGTEITLRESLVNLIFNNE